MSRAFFRVIISLVADVLLRSVWIPWSLIAWPRYFNILRWTYRRFLRCSSQGFPLTIVSSRYENACYSIVPFFLRTKEIWGLYSLPTDSIWPFAIKLLTSAPIIACIARLRVACLSLKSRSSFMTFCVLQISWLHISSQISVIFVVKSTPVPVFQCLWSLLVR